MITKILQFFYYITVVLRLELLKKFLPDFLELPVSIRGNI